MANIALNDIKQAPFSHEAEQSVIGGLLLDQTAWDDISVIVSVDDFYSKIHRTIFQAVSVILSSGRSIDLITLQEELEGSGSLESVGGFVYLVEIVRVTPSAANITAYAKIVKERSLTRSMIARNTPTGVGKTLAGFAGADDLRKHPHGRGEDAAQRAPYVPREETPPRAWGRRADHASKPAKPGNTPTGVGKTIPTGRR